MRTRLLSQVCWDGVDNDGCVDEYRVSAAKQSSAAGFRSSDDGDKAISKGACVNVTRLENDAQYK